MRHSKVNRTHLYEKIFYSILAVFLTIFSVILYNKENSNLFFKGIAGVIFIIIVFYAYQVIKNTDYLIQIALSIFFTGILIMNFIDIFLQSLQSSTLFLNFNKVIYIYNSTVNKIFFRYNCKATKIFFRYNYKATKIFFRYNYKATKII